MLLAKKENWRESTVHFTQIQQRGESAGKKELEGGKDERNLPQL